TAEGSIDETAKGSIDETAKGSIDETAKGSIDETAKGSADRNESVAGAQGTRYLMGLGVFLPGQPTKSQPIDLCFDSAWTATATPVSVHFNALGGVAINPPQATGWEDGQVSAIQFEPVHLGRPEDTRQEAARKLTAPGLGAPLATNGQPRRRFGSLLQVVLVALLTMLYTRHNNASPCQENSMQPNCTFSLHEAFNRVASCHVTAALSMTGTITHPNKSLGLVDLRTDLSELGSEMSQLCVNYNSVPERPDIEKLCREYSAAFRTANTLHRKCYLPFNRVTQLLKQAAIDLGNIDHSRWDDGDVQGYDESEDESVGRARRRRQNAQVAGTLLGHIPEWRRHYVEQQERLREFEHCLRKMESNAGYIIEAFEYEARRGSFVKHYTEDIKFSIALLKAEHLPFAAALLNLTDKAIELVDSGASELARLETALTDVSVVPTFLRRLRLLLTPGTRAAGTEAACELEMDDLFWARTKIEDTVKELWAKFNAAKEEDAPRAYWTSQRKARNERQANRAKRLKSRKRG
ncbi:hypothetical protein C8A00DRAFT_37045, partial [Chaetomidium leptoderma]